MKEVIMQKLSIVIASCSVIVLAAGCGSSPEPQLGNDRNTAPAQALSAIRSALEQMYSWRPEQDSSRAAGYERARPYLTAELAAQQAQLPPRGNGAQWERWKLQRATVKAQAAVVDSDHPPDGPDRIVRTVIVTQRVLGADGRELEKQAPLTIAHVMAVRNEHGWQVGELKY